MDKKDADDAADKVGRGEHPNQVKGDAMLLRAIEGRAIKGLPPPLPESLKKKDQKPGKGDEPAAP